MKIRQLFDHETWTYTYIVYDEISRQAAIIDSVKEKFNRDSCLIADLGLHLKYAFETHVHADHVTASGRFREKFLCEIGVYVDSGNECADIKIRHGDVFSLGDQIIEAIHTPGHTNGDISYRIEGAVFTGDALLIRACGRTDFQQGDSAELYESITGKLFSLPDDTIVYPGHDYDGFTSSTIGEEKTLNPRLANEKTKDEFMHIMNNLNLPKPIKFDIAVPSNLMCGL